MPVPVVKITAKVARCLVSSATSLIDAGTMVVASEDGTPLSPSLLSTIPGDIAEEEDPAYWANMLLFFARTVRGILTQALLEGEEEI